MLISTIVYSSFLKYSCIGIYTVKVYIIYSLLYPDDITLFSYILKIQCYAVQHSKTLQGTNE